MPTLRFFHGVSIFLSPSTGEYPAKYPSNINLINHMHPLGLAPELFQKSPLKPVSAIDF
jgi:hypothetical protein